MKFWRGNRVDAEFDMPTAEVAAKFAAWYAQQPDDEKGGNMEREVRWWLTSGEHFNSVWVNETGPDSFSELFDKILDLVYPEPAPVLPPGGICGECLHPYHGAGECPTKIEARLADFMHRHATVEVSDEAGGKHRGRIVSIVVPAAGTDYKPGSKYGFALDCDSGGRLSCPFTATVIEVITAEIDTTEGPRRSGDPDYSVNHVS